MGNSVPNGSPASFPPPANLKTLWDMKLVYKMIINKQLAPFFPYVDDEDATVHAEECPICLNYVVGGMNRSKCCNKGLCTACYITIKKTPTTPFGCPFCLGPSLEVVYRGPKTLEEIRSELDDAKKVDDLKRKMREEEIEADRQRELKREKEREEAAQRQRAAAEAQAERERRKAALKQQMKEAEEMEPDLAQAILMSLEINGEGLTPRTSSTTTSSNTKPTPNPSSTSKAPPPPPKDDKFPEHIITILNDPNSTDEQRDAAQYEAAIWLSLHSESEETKGNQ